MGEGSQDNTLGARPEPHAKAEEFKRAENAKLAIDFSEITYGFSGSLVQQQLRDPNKPNPSFDLWNKISDETPSDEKIPYQQQLSITHIKDLPTNRDSRQLPGDFQLPATEVMLRNIGTKRHKGRVNYVGTATSKFGRTNLYILDANNKIWSVGNSLLFNEQGQALKREYFFRELEAEAGDYDDSNITKVDEPVSQNDSRYVQLEPEDYELAKGIVHQVQRGDFT